LIKNVTVISPERSRALPNAVVVIRGGRIAEIGTNLVVDTQANQIDGHGGFLIPGPIDSRVCASATWARSTMRRLRNILNCRGYRGVEDQPPGDREAFTRDGRGRVGEGGNGRARMSLPI